MQDCVRLRRPIRTSCVACQSNRIDARVRVGIPMPSSPVLCRLTELAELRQDTKTMMAMLAPLESISKSLALLASPAVPSRAAVESILASRFDPLGACKSCSWLRTPFSRVSVPTLANVSTKIAFWI